MVKELDIEGAIQLIESVMDESVSRGGGSLKSSVWGRYFPRYFRCRECR